MKTEKYIIVIVCFWLFWFSLGREYYKPEPKDWIYAITVPITVIGCFIAAEKLEQFLDPVDESKQKARLDGLLSGLPLFLLVITGILITEVTYLGSYPALYTTITLALICVTWFWVGRGIILRVRSNRQQSTSDNSGNSDGI